jgi:iron complex transport system ATP-binding protein
MKVLELREATLTRGGRAILDAVSLTIRAGEHTAILGPNGSGKSSLVKLLTHHHHARATPGAEPPVRVMGEALWNVERLRSHLGIVSPELHEHFVTGSSMGPITVLEAVISGFFASEVIFLHHEVTSEMRERALRALEVAGAAHLAEKRMSETSTGEARRALIARALVTGPPVLVLDEPTTGLDVVARSHFLDRLATIARGPATILLITHHAEEILPAIGRVILLDRGRVAFDGPKEEALTAERLTGLFGSPVRVSERQGWYSLAVEPPPSASGQS